MIEATDGARREFALAPMSVAEFHTKFTGALVEIGAPTEFHNTPNEVPDPVPFAAQTAAGAYDPAAAADFWRALVAIDGVFKHFRTSYLGKVSPVHLFWGSFDLAVTRFSGRAAPLHPGGIPALPDPITQEAYSHEVSSSGFWPGGGGLDYPAFYSYAYPTPDGFSKAPITNKDAFFSDSLGEFVLPYDAVRSAVEPNATLLQFLQETYDAAADGAGWDRGSLDCEIGAPARPKTSLTAIAGALATKRQ